MSEHVKLTVCQNLVYYGARWHGMSVTQCYREGLWLSWESATIAL